MSTLITNSITIDDKRENVSTSNCEWLTLYCKLSFLITAQYIFLKHNVKWMEPNVIWMTVTPIIQDRVHISHDGSPKSWHNKLQYTCTSKIIYTSYCFCTVGIENYWTAGIYNIPLRNWYWYTDNSRNKAPFSYRNWLNGMEPAATSIYDVCSVFTVNVPTTASYWQKNDCTNNNYYICKIPKQCL